MKRGDAGASLYDIMQDGMGVLLDAGAEGNSTGAIRYPPACHGGMSPSPTDTTGRFATIKAFH